eukprot:scaffold269915_cov48-Prasinocladus_malaysianus.AAC.1
MADLYDSISLEKRAMANRSSLLCRCLLPTQPMECPHRFERLCWPVFQVGEAEGPAGGPRLAHSDDGGAVQASVQFRGGVARDPAVRPGCHPEALGRGRSGASEAPGRGVRALAASTAQIRSEQRDLDFLLVSV